MKHRWCATGLLWLVGPWETSLLVAAAPYNRSVSGPNLRSTSRASGFTLIEMLVAILILGFVITTALAVFLDRTRRIQRASELILAYQALSNEAEVRRRIDFNQLDGAQKSFISDLAIIAPLPKAVTSVEVSDVSPARKNVKMTVTWRGGKQTATLTLIRTHTGGSNLW